MPRIEGEVAELGETPGLHHHLALDETRSGAVALREKEGNSMNRRFSTGLHGCYRDRLLAGDGKVLDASHWRANCIVNDCNRLLAALMKRAAEMTGILYLALGEGEAEWDGSVQEPDPSAARLAHECYRQFVEPREMEYVAENGVTTEDRICITVSFDGSRLAPSKGYQRLREFGLFGGDAGPKADSGTLVNYVIHPRIDLTPRMTLVREVELHFGASVGAEAHAPASHTMEHTRGAASADGALSKVSVQNIDGIGPKHTAALAGIGITTVGQLADADLREVDVGIPESKLADFQAKAVVAVTATETDASLGAEERARAAALQLALDNRFLKRIDVTRLTGQAG